MLHPIPEDIIIPGRSVSRGKPPCPRQEVPLTPWEKLPSQEPTFSLSKGSFHSPGETKLLGKPHLFPSRGFFHSPRNAPSRRQEVNSAPWGRHSLPKCPKAHPDLWPPPPCHLPWGKALTYFEIGVISVGIVSMDEVEVFELCRSINKNFIPNVYILFNLYHGCIPLQTSLKTNPSIAFMRIEIILVPQYCHYYERSEFQQHHQIAFSMIAANQECLIDHISILLQFLHRTNLIN